MKKYLITLMLCLLLYSCNTCLKDKGVYYIKFAHFSVVYPNEKNCSTSDTCKNIKVVEIIAEGNNYYRDTFCVPSNPQHQELFGTDCVVSLSIKEQPRGQDTVIIILPNRKDTLTDFIPVEVNECDMYYWKLKINNKEYEIHPGDYITLD